MEQAKLLRADYLDILFDGRNKLYGGYELRRKYADRARRATAIVILSVALAAVLPVVAASLSPDQDITLRPPTGETILTNIQPDKPQVPLVAVPEPPAVAATEEFVPLVVVKNEEVTEPPTAVEALNGKEIGLHVHVGTPGGEAPDLGGPVGVGHEILDFPPAEKKHKEPFTTVDQMPVFNGDLPQFLQDHLRYPDEARAGGEEGRVGIHFVVNEDGSISDAEVTHKSSALLDAEALRVVRSMPRWKPGKQGGKPVKVYFTLPITFRLD